MENLIKIKSYTINTKDIMTVQTNAGTYVITEIGIPNFKNKIGIPNNSTIVSVSSAQSPGYCEYCTYNYNEDSAYVGNIVNSANPRWVTINVAYI
ncbi:hypothetical protein [Fusobacterium polymorphum]|uniref:hypothetical protein n=1 Tax=Fusobacterium nucleatum subsp. polymorphum TaxID=76857 RepID=UPI0030093D6B